MDLKEFNGGVWEFDKFLTWAKDVVLAEYPTVNKDTQIVVGKPHGIDAEWRLFMRDNGEVLACSQYKKKGRVHIDEKVPQAVLDKASEIAKLWAPAPIFTLDLALSGESLWIVEAQSIQSSGFYAANLTQYIQGIERFYQERVIAPGVGFKL